MVRISDKNVKGNLCSIKDKCYIFFYKAEATKSSMKGNINPIQSAPPFSSNFLQIFSSDLRNS